MTREQRLEEALRQRLEEALRRCVTAAGGSIWDNRQMMNRRLRAINSIIAEALNPPKVVEIALPEAAPLPVFAEPLALIDETQDSAT